MKRVIFVLLAVFAAAPAFAGDRFDGLTTGNALEGIILDREINGIDPLRNPAVMIYATKLKLAIDSSAYGTGNNSPFKFTLSLPMPAGIIIFGNIRYGNQSTWDTWQGTAPGAALAYTGALNVADSNTTLVETGVIGNLNDDWTRTTVYSGTDNTVAAQGGRLDALGGFAMKMGDNLIIGGRAGIETNGDGTIKDSSSYAYTVSEVVPLNSKGAGSANEGFTGTRTITREQKTATDPTAIKIVGGALMKISGMDLDFSALARLKTGEVSDKATAVDTVDLDPDGDNAQTANTNDWIGLNTYVTNGRKSGVKSISRNYSGAIGGMDLGVNGILRMAINPSTTFAVPVSFSSTPYSYTQNRTDTTNITAIATMLMGGTVNNTAVYQQISSDVLSCAYTASTIGVGAGINNKMGDYNIGIGLKITMTGTQTTLTTGVNDNRITTQSNTNAGATGFTNYSQSVTFNCNDVTTITKTSLTAIYLPLGIEGKIADRLTIRGGFTQAWLMTKTLGDSTITTVTTPSVTNSTTDGVVAATIIGSTQTNTVVTNTLPESSNNTMCTYYNLGLGYDVTDNLHVDISTNGNIFSIANIRASAVLVF